jgi:multicomponent Na+:H+ antiporter subunit E
MSAFDPRQEKTQPPDSVLVELRETMRRWTLRTVALRLVILTILWIVLTEGDLRYWGLVLATVAIATFVSLLLVPESGLRWSVMGWLGFIPYFLWHSVQGGVDVALRATAPSPRIDPVYVRCRLRLTEEAARVIVANTMSLMPGTLSVRLDGPDLELHVLDGSMPSRTRVRELEDHAARMFHLELPAADDEIAEHPTGR